MVTINKKDGRTERRFFVAMTDKEVIQAKENKNTLKSTYKIPLSRVLREVILHWIYKREFLEFIGLIEKPAVKE